MIDHILFSMDQKSMFQNAVWKLIFLVLSIFTCRFGSIQRQKYVWIMEFSCFHWILSVEINCLSIEFVVSRKKLMNHYKINVLIVKQILTQHEMKSNQMCLDWVWLTKARSKETPSYAAYALSFVYWLEQIDFYFTDIFISKLLKLAWRYRLVQLEHSSQYKTHNWIENTFIIIANSFCTHYLLFPIFFFNFISFLFKCVFVFNL